jgi:hypothetical protein
MWKANEIKFGKENVLNENGKCKTQKDRTAEIKINELVRLY